MGRRAFFMSGVILGCAGVGLFLGIAIQVWYLRAEVDRQTAYLAEQGERAGSAAADAVWFVEKTLEEAKKQLEATRKTAAAAPVAPSDPLLRITARQMSKQLVGSVERAQGAVVAAADAVVIADAALEVVNEWYPDLKTFLGLSPDQMDQTKVALGTVAGQLQQARGFLGVPIDDGLLPTAEQLKSVDDALTLAEGFASHMKQVVETARSRVRDLKVAADRLTWRGSIAITLVSLLGALGQCFLVRFCWRKAHHQPA